MSTNYQKLPPGRRGASEITVAGPELAVVAAAAANAAAAAVLAEASAEQAVAAGGKATVEKKAARAAAVAAGRVLIPEVPGVVAWLHAELDVPKDRLKQLVLRWPRLLEVRDRYRYRMHQAINSIYCAFTTACYLCTITVVMGPTEGGRNSGYKLTSEKQIQNICRGILIPLLRVDCRDLKMWYA